MTELAHPVPRSPAAQEASRRNGARSRGPKTARGKRDAAKNAIRHGLRARDPVLPENLPRWIKGFEARMIDAVGHVGQRRRELLDLLLQVLVLVERTDRLIVAELAKLPRPEGAGGQAAHEVRQRVLYLRKLFRYRKRFQAQRDHCIRRIIRR